MKYEKVRIRFDRDLPGVRRPCLWWKAKDGTVYRAPDTEQGRAVLDRRRKL